MDSKKSESNLKRIQDYYDYLINILSLVKLTKLIPENNNEYLKKIEETALEALNEFLNLRIERTNFFSRDVYPTPLVKIETLCFNKENSILIEDETKFISSYLDLFSTPIYGVKNLLKRKLNSDIKDEDIKLISVISIKNEDINQKVNSLPLPEIRLYFKVRVDEEKLTLPKNLKFYQFNDLYKLSFEVDSDKISNVLDAFISDYEDCIYIN